MAEAPRGRTGRARLLRALGLIAALAAGCSTSDPLSRPTEQLFTGGPEPDYATYLQRTRAHLRRHSVAAGDLPRRQQIAWRMAFERAPGAGCDGRLQTGLLLIHGLADTPFIFRDLAHRLAERCVRVRTILLPGHGMRPVDLVAAESRRAVDGRRAGARAGAGGTVHRFPGARAGDQPP